MAKKILIIDDDKIFLKILKDRLISKKGGQFDVVTAYDGEEGLRKAMEEKPNLIVSDLMMPKINGLELVKKMQADNELSKIPVLISTQSPDVDNISEATELGVKGYIVKSDYAIDGIVQKIEDILEAEETNII